MWPLTWPFIKKIVQKVRKDRIRARSILVKCFLIYAGIWKKCFFWIANSQMTNDLRFLPVSDNLISWGNESLFISLAHKVMVFENLVRILQIVIPYFFIFSWPTEMLPNHATHHIQLIESKIALKYRGENEHKVEFLPYFEFLLIH